MKRTIGRWLWDFGLLLVAVMAMEASAWGQSLNPVYVDDAPAAVDGLARAMEFRASGNLDEAVRVLQRLLDEEGRRLVATQRDSDLFIDIRSAVLAMFSADGRLLERHRQLMGPVAEARLAAGEEDRVAETLPLTQAGFEAILRVTQRRFERGQFFSAFRLVTELERHPDRLGTAGEDAARLATLMARYLATEESVELAQRWRREAGLDEVELGAIAPPALNQGRMPLDPGPATALGDIVSKPLWSERHTLTPQDLQPERGVSRRSPANDEVSVRLRQQHIMPTVAGDLVYVNDGNSVSAYDRFTLALRWRRIFPSLRPDKGIARVLGAAKGIEDLATVTISGPWAIATTGLGSSTGRVGEGLVRGLDALTGADRWWTDIDKLDPSLEGASVRGPAVVDQGVAVISTVKRHRQRRLDSLHMTGLDLATGELLWTRPIASIGQLPYQQRIKVTEPALLKDGVAYVSNSLGVLAAVEPVTGRLLWLRRSPAATARRSDTPPWEVGPPAIADGVLYAVSPSLGSILALDIATGDVIAERTMGRVGGVHYVLALGERLILVGSRRIYSTPFDRFDDEQFSPVEIATLEPQAMGHVIVAGDELIVPLQGGMLIVRFDDRGDAVTEQIPLEFSGNVLANESQLIVVDDFDVHTYLIWETARRLLTERMQSEPGDATPAAVFAELAHRAGHPEHILTGVDAAIDAIQSDPASEDNQRARARLFDATLAMVDPEPADLGAALPNELVTSLVNRLARLASDPEERVLQLLVSGSHAVSQGRIGDAVEAHQRILADETLAAVNLTRHHRTLDAQSEAFGRLRELIRSYGRGVYAAHDREADRVLSEVRGAMNPEQFVSIARRYPVSRAASRAWLAAAQAFSARGRRHGAIYALEQGLSAGEFALDPDDPILGELAGRLILALDQAGRIAAARTTLDSFLTANPLALLTDGAQTLDVEALRGSLDERLLAQNRRPRVGPILGAANTSVLEGFWPTKPLFEERSVRRGESALLSSSRMNALALFEPDVSGGIDERWRITLNERGAAAQTQVVSLDDSSVFVLRFGEMGGTLSRIDRATGRTIWSTLGFRSLFAAQDPATPKLFDDDGRPMYIETGTHGPLPLSQLVVAQSGSVLTMVERSGRAVGISLETGRTLWKRTELADVVVDASASAGLLAVGALNLSAEEAVAPTAALIALDLRTGRVLHEISPELGLVRWVRMTEEGRMVAGLDDGVASIDLFRGKVRWMVGGKRGGGTREAWVFPGRVLVLTELGELVQIETETGEIRKEALDSRSLLQVNPTAATAQEVYDRAAFITPHGILLFDRRGGLVGSDHRPSLNVASVGTLAQDYIVAVDQASMPGEQQGVFALRLHTATSCKLVMERLISLAGAPEEIALLDGRILIGFDDATLVVETPAPQ